MSATFATYFCGSDDSEPFCPPMRRQSLPRCCKEMLAMFVLWQPTDFYAVFEEIVSMIKNIGCVPRINLNVDKNRDVLRCPGFRQ